MREIKFRAWDMTSKNMYDLNEIEDYPYAYIVKGDTPYTKFMQYTGLKDKNGKEIYEGDILEVTSELTTNFGKTPTGRFQTSYFEVTWGEEGWKTKVLKSKHIVVGSLWGLIIEAKYGTICGNIYENPELLVK